jgi:hypothetical protein
MISLFDEKFKNCIVHLTSPSVADPNPEPGLNK